MLDIILIYFYLLLVFFLVPFLMFVLVFFSPFIIWDFLIHDIPDMIKKDKDTIKKFTTFFVMCIWVAISFGLFYAASLYLGSHDLAAPLYALAFFIILPIARRLFRARYDQFVERVSRRITLIGRIYVETILLTSGMIAGYFLSGIMGLHGIIATAIGGVLVGLLAESVLFSIVGIFLLVHLGNFAFSRFGRPAHDT